MVNPPDPARVSCVPLGMSRSVPVLPLNVKDEPKVLGPSVTYAPLVKRNAASVSVGTLLTMGDGVTLPSKMRTSLVAGLRRTGDQFVDTLHFWFGRPIYV